jgi:hypothetical protein
VRSTSVLTKKPISPSTSLLVRPATGVPTLIRSSPVYRYSSAWKAAKSSMNSVTPSLRLTCLSDSVSCPSNSKPTVAPR